jgi:hypothetical protein
MSKAIANRILKAHGLGFVKYSSQSSFEKTPCITNRDNKRMQGIYCSRVGPLTVTDSHVAHYHKKVADITTELQDQFKKVDELRFVISEDSCSIVYLTFDKRYLPTYQRKDHMDLSYQSIYLMPVYSKVKKIKVDKALCFPYTIRRQ